MATVEQVWRAVFPQARRFGADEALGRQVAWVRVLKPRTPAFDALEPDDLALLPEAALASLRGLGVDTSQVVDAVAEAKANGVLVVGSEPSVERAAELATRAGLAAFTLFEGDIAALERSAISFIVNARAELEARAGQLEIELEQQVLAGAGAEGLAATISRFLARPVAIEGADGSLLAMHAPPDVDEATPSLSQYLRQRRGAALRVALPVIQVHAAGDRPRSSGALVLLGPAAPSELDRVATNRVAPFLALALGTAGAASPTPARPPDRLPADGPPWVAIVARQLDEDAPTTAAERERVRDALRRVEPAHRLALRGDASSLELRVVAAPGPADPQGVALAGRIGRHLGRPVAVSTAFADPADRPVREAEARTTLEAFEALPATEQRAIGADTAVARADMLPAYQLLATLAALPDATRHARALLAPLLTGRRLRDGQALATLRALLDHGGMAEAAAALGIHRNTLAYRLAAIERRTGWQLTDPLLRFALGLAIRLVQSEQDDAKEATVLQPRRSPPGQ